MKRIMLIIWSAVICNLATAHQTFQQKIPNGAAVPHPCKPDAQWKGVGHENENGGGVKNAFGKDFEENGLVWNATICLKDSDGDGKSNGQELGDPDCLWSPDETPAFITELSHPGVCDPLDSAICKDKSDFVDCEDKEFTCPVVEGEDSSVISEFEAKLGRAYFKPQVTLYICQSFKFPDMEQHIVGFKPIIDNEYLVHHILVFGCRGTYKPEPPNKCGMVPSSQCTDIIAVWSIGMTGHCMHKDCGILVGGTKGYTWGYVQVHWNNPQLLANQYDSSGIIFDLSSKLRPFNAGILSIGQTDIAIPPGKAEYTESGTCDASCTERIIHDDIVVVSVYNHMHYLGKAQTTDLIRRNGSTEQKQHLAYDEVYNYDDPILHEFHDGVTVRAGDALTTKCVYSSISKTDTTYFGDETNDEMCFSFLTYFPVENSEQLCISNGKDATCNAKDSETCNLDIFSFTNPEMLLLLKNIQSLCVPGLCRNECLIFMKEMQKDPCYETITGTLRRAVTKPNDFSYHLNVMFAAFDSCNLEILKEEMTVLRKNQDCQEAHDDDDGDDDVGDVGDGWFTLSMATKSKAQELVFGITLLCLVMKHELF